MAAQYDQLADKYSGITDFLCRVIEAHTLREALGSVEGQSALDLACGEGLYTRRLKQWGAARVVGVDISQEMINNALRYEQAQPLGVEYCVSDVAEMPDLGTFDVALSVYLLHYATRREHLLRICQRAHAHLRPGGRFIAYTVNPDFSARLPNSTRYGITMVDFPESPQEGQALSAVLHAETPFTIHFHYWSRATYEWALREAGFRDLAWVKPSCPPEGLVGHGPAFWQDYVDNPHAVLLSARR